MNYYLIDLENTGSEVLTNLCGVKKGSKIVIFYSENYKKISLDLINNIEKVKAFCETVKVNTGTKNALDFQLSTYLGFLIAKDSNNENTYYIVSKDQGYSATINFWKNRKVHIDQGCDFTDIQNKQKQKKK